MAERLEPVTDFASLRAGMLVVCTPCGWCGGRHRGLLVEWNPNQKLVRHSGRTFTADCWSLLPIGCRPKPLAVTPSSVKEGIVFRVVDGLDESATTTRRRRIKRDAPVSLMCDVPEDKQP